MILHGPGRQRKVPEKVDSNAGGGDGEGSNGGGGEGEENDGGGGEGDCNDGENDDQVVSSLTQLLYFHAVKRKRHRKSQAAARRHVSNRETPVPVAVVMKVYGETRNKGLTEFLHHLGRSISYSRLQDILTANVNKLCYR